MPPVQEWHKIPSVSYLICPITRFLICRSAISLSPGLTWALNEMKYRKAVGTLSQEQLCRSCVFAQFLRQLRLLLLFMSSTRWTAGTAKQSLIHFPTFPFVSPFENLKDWSQDAKPEQKCHDFFASFRVTSNLGHQLQWISQYFYFQ